MSALRNLAAVLTGLVRVHTGDRVCVSCGARTDHVSYRRYLAWRESGVLTCRCGGVLQNPSEISKKASTPDAPGAPALTDTHPPQH